jgi:tetratricopeptide (TPR) repeat protein
MLSKQIVVTLPLALLLVELFFIRNKEGRINLRFLSVFAGAVAFFILAGLSLYGLPRESQEIPRDVYLITSFKVMVKYLQMFVVPANQNLDHDIEASETLFGWRELVSLAILLGLIYLAYRQFRKNPLISFGIAWFFITLSVEQSLIPIKDFMFEHRVYLPSLGLIIASLAALFTYLPTVNLNRSKVPGAIFLTGILVLVYGITANARNNVWKTDLSLWSDAVKKSPEKARPYLWQGIAYTNVQQFEEAKASIDKCIELLPNFPMAYYNRGNIYKDLGQFREAMADYDKAIMLDSTYMLAYFNRGVVSGKLGLNKKAISDYNRTLKEDPDNVNTLYNRGNAHRKLRQYKQAIADYDRVIKIDPEYTLAIFNRGLSKAATGDHEEALKDFDLAIRKDTKNHLFFNGKGVSLYQLGRYDEAIANYDAALRVNPNFGQAYYNRGFAKFFGKGDPQGGCADWETALKYKYPSARGMLIQYCGKTAQNLQ